jgi:dsRNA-specific ribonuclease
VSVQYQYKYLECLGAGVADSANTSIYCCVLEYPKYCTVHYSSTRSSIITNYTRVRVTPNVVALESIV